MNHSITIIGGKKAYLSERFAYKEYFENNGFRIFLKDEVGVVGKIETDIIWVMMGFHLLGNGITIQTIKKVFYIILNYILVLF